MTQEPNANEIVGNLLREAAERFAALCETHGLTIRATFVPFSQSDRAHERKGRGIDGLSLNWRVDVLHKGRKILETPYSKGVGHCPSYARPVTLAVAEALHRECETGRAASASNTFFKGKAIDCGAVDLLANVVGNADVLMYSSFEDWASAVGSDPDSRSAEAIYRTCLQHALALRNAIGNDALEALMEAAREL